MMRKLKALIVDDEATARRGLNSLLEKYADQLEVCGQADSVKTAIPLIKEVKPDIVFLDIQMPGENGFKLIEQLDHIDFDIVFVTAFDNFAIKAIRYSALDYVLKPVKKEDLAYAIEKCFENAQNKNTQTAFKSLVHNVNSGKQDKKIVFNESHRTTVVRPQEIMRCESERNYTRIFIKGNYSILMPKTLKIYEQLLEDFGFFRAHKSHLVNINEIVRLDKIDSLIELSDKTSIPVSARRKSELNEILRQL